MKLNTQTKTGILVVAILIIAVWGFNFLKGFNFVNDNHSYFVLYDNVSGLVKSSAVRLHGYRIGQVKDITFSKDAKRPMLVEINIEKNIKFPIGTSARISGSGIMGDKDITIALGESTQLHSYGDTIIGSIDDDLMSMLDPMKSQAENAINALTATMLNINDLLNDETQQSIRQSLQSLQNSLENVERLTQKGNSILENENPKISQSMDNITEFTEIMHKKKDDINSIISNLKKTSEMLATTDINETLSELKNTLTSINKIIADASEGDGTLAKLIKDDELYDNLNTLSKDLDYLVTDFNNRPEKYLKISAISFGKDKFYSPLPQGHFDNTVTFKVAIASNLPEEDFKREIEQNTESDPKKWYYDDKEKYYYYNTLNNFVRAFEELQKVQNHFANTEIKSFKNGKEKTLENLMKK
ncbi:MAG: MlaD family protein [Bacteroidales bacterium]